MVGKCVGTSLTHPPYHFMSNLPSNATLQKIRRRNLVVREVELLKFQSRNAMRISSSRRYNSMASKVN